MKIADFERAIDALGVQGLEILEMKTPNGADGMQSQDIAYRMCISKVTVDHHRQNILQKLGKHSVTELAAWYHSQVKLQDGQ